MAELEADLDSGVAERRLGQVDIVVERMMRFELDLIVLAEVQEVHLQTRVELAAEAVEAVPGRSNLELEDKPAT